jgi:YHS domain-containing protein
LFPLKKRKVFIFFTTNHVYMRQILLSLAVAVLALPVFADDKTLVNTDKTGVALQGYDPVAFCTDGKPIKGTADFQSTDHDVVYRFATAEHKALFDANPGKYEPAFGGYCAFVVAKGHLASVEVAAFQVVDGHLLMQHSLGVRDAFNKNQKDNLATATATWPKLVEEKGK